MNYGVASGYADYSGELYIIKRLKPYLSKGIIFDVGANVGDWSKFLIKTLPKNNYTLHLFEPTSNSYKALKKNLQKNNNLFFHPIGLGLKNESNTIYYDHIGQGSASISGKGKYSETIELMTLDTFCEQNGINSIDFLKIDVQGYEYNILKGADKMLAGNHIKCIQFEIDEPAIDQRIFFKDFWDLLSPKFNVYHSLFNGLVEIENYNFKKENFHCMNYLAILKTMDFKP